MAIDSNPPVNLMTDGRSTKERLPMIHESRDYRGMIRTSDKDVRMYESLHGRRRMSSGLNVRQLQFKERFTRRQKLLLKIAAPQNMFFKSLLISKALFLVYHVHMCSVRVLYIWCGGQKKNNFSLFYILSCNHINTCLETVHRFLPFTVYAAAESFISGVVSA